MSIFGQNCPTLSQKVLLNPHSVHSAEVDPLPHGDPVRNLRELREEAFPQSFYLLPASGGFCAYPLRSLASPIFSLSDFFPSEVRNLPALFGKPTSLEVPPNLPSGAAIYEAWDDQVYLPDVSGLRWYLVGNAEKYGHFVSGIARYAQELLEEWRRNPDAMIRATWETPEDLQPTGLPPPSPLEAWWEIGKFGAWMQGKDPGLWAKAQAQLHYDLEMPEEGCKNEITEDGYAYYTPAQDQILLLPRSIHLLKEGKYAAVAQVLAHEVAHRENVQAGLVLPSDELMQRSLELFHDLVAEEHPLWGLGLALFREPFQREIHCRRLPMLPEEEIDAFFSDLLYGRFQPPSHASAETQDESVEALVWLIEQVNLHFPWTWRSLMADYVELAQANHRQRK